jgi:hypothetical protein
MAQVGCGQKFVSECGIAKGYVCGGFGLLMAEVGRLHVVDWDW